MPKPSLLLLQALSQKASAKLPLQRSLHKPGSKPRHWASPTLFLHAQSIQSLVQQLGVSACIAGVAQRIKAEFLNWQHYEKQARVASHSALGAIELMPVASSEQFAFKYVNGHPTNTALGLPTVMAFGVLADVATGKPTVLAELTLLTAIRTAAMSALAAQHLARPGSRSMALIGNGAQSEFQALAFRDLLGIENVRLFDVDPAASAKLKANLRASGMQITPCHSAAEAVQGVDIITTATADKRRAHILTPQMVQPGQHINAIGGDCPGKTELHPGVLAAASVFVEFEPQTRVEGELQQMPASFPCTEFWQVLAGSQAGRRSPQETTVFDSVGFALEDLAAMAFATDAARELGLGQEIELVLQAPDPKDLYGTLAVHQAGPELEIESGHATA